MNIDTTGITIDGKTYRNLPEQVAYLSEQIKDLQNTVAPGEVVFYDLDITNWTTVDTEGFAYVLGPAALRSTDAIIAAVISSVPHYVTITPNWIASTGEVYFSIYVQDYVPTATVTIRFYVMGKEVTASFNTIQSYAYKATAGSGSQGKDGVGIASVEQTTTSTQDGGYNVVTITLTDGTASSFRVRNGTKGPKGDTGPQGIQGVQGPQGEKGDPYTLTEADKAAIVSAAAESLKSEGSGVVLYTPQTLTAAQQEQARANLGIVGEEQYEFVNSVQDIPADADTSKKYVIDGYIYTYQKKTVEVIYNANDGTGFINARPKGATGSDKDANTTQNGMFSTAPIPVDKTWSSAIATISGLEKLVPTFYASLYIYFFDVNGTFLFYRANNQIVPAGSNHPLTNSPEVEIPLPVSVDLVYDFVNSGSRDLLSANNVGYIRFALGIKLSSAITDADIKSLVINIDRLNTEKTEYGWYSTGVPFSGDQAVQENAAAIANLETRVTALENLGGSSAPVSSGAKWYALGDSITYGLYSTSASDYHQPVIGKRWVDYVATYNGYELTNLGVSGSGFVTGTTFRTIVDRNNFSGVNLVTIMLGINDWKNEAAVNKVGTMDDDISTGGTIVSELRYGLEKIIADNPYCKIILITPINAKIGSRGTEATNWAYGYTGNITPCGSLKNFNDKLKEVCEYYGIQVIDMTNSSVVNRKSIITVLPDGIHPNLDCYKALGLELARRITFA